MSLLLWILLFFLLAILAVILCYQWISLIANPYLYNTTDTIPYRETALLLGTAKYTSGGHLNRFFANRINSAIAIYHAKKADKILISGADKFLHAPDEVDFMQQALYHSGIPLSSLLKDHQGSRTWYSVLLCKTKYRLTDPLIISQKFHNQRAVFIALHMGMQPIAINAEKVTGKAGLRIILREALARVKCLMDCYLLKPKLPG